MVEFISFTVGMSCEQARSGQTSGDSENRDSLFATGEVLGDDNDGVTGVAAKYNRIMKKQHFLLLVCFSQLSHAKHSISMAVGTYPEEIHCLAKSPDIDDVECLCSW